MKKEKLIDKLGPQKWGYLRETAEKAKSAGLDSVTGLHRTGLEEYLKVIFPNVNDWVHDKKLCKASEKWRPDYQSETLKVVVEFDGLRHYTDEAVIRHDEEKDDWYNRRGYKVVRIPYFIQLTNAAVKKLFGVNVNKKLFDERFPSLGARGSFPQNICRDGIRRMAREFAQFPEQYDVNIGPLKALREQMLSDVKMLEHEYKKAIKAKKGIRK